LRFGLVAFLFLLTDPALAADTNHGLRVPDGFVVTEFADEKLANDIYTMTLDPRGRVVVSSRGYIRTLIDDDSDGRTDRAVELPTHRRTAPWASCGKATRSTPWATAVCGASASRTTRPTAPPSYSAP
jgi:hypothetical protein